MKTKACCKASHAQNSYRIFNESRTNMSQDSCFKISNPIEWIDYFPSLIFGYRING